MRKSTETWTTALLRPCEGLNGESISARGNAKIAVLSDNDAIMLGASKYG